MGIVRFITTILNHKATSDSYMLKVPIIDCLLIDYNANIHYVLFKIITELNEILYYTYYRDNDPNNLDIEITQYQNLELSIDEIENKLEYYSETYNIGTSYSDISTFLKDFDNVINIIFCETISYTRILVCSLNRGWLKKVYLALDGVPSKAKTKEQRNRRYVSAHINNTRENIVKKYKFAYDKIFQIDQFHYRSLICPGTMLMEKIQQALFHLDIHLDVSISTTEINGEGEKKIIHALENDLDMYDNYCIMSPDSDMLILMSLLVNNKKFQDKNLYNFRIDYQNKNQYQFFDLHKMINNFTNYYSDKLHIKYQQQDIIDAFFLLFVFGNDFLPKLEPLNISNHFDYICETCLNINKSDQKFITNDGKLNYLFLLEFFRAIENKTLDFAISQYYNSKYVNYNKLCIAMTLTDMDIKNNKCHSSLQPLIVDSMNFIKISTDLHCAYQKLINFLRNTFVQQDKIQQLYNEVHSDMTDSHMLFV